MSTSTKQRSLQWQQARADAMRYPCTDCNKPAGAVCVNLRDGYELERQAAHLCRLKLAGYELPVLA